MTFCNYGEFTVAKVGNSSCNFVHLHYAINTAGAVHLSPSLVGWFKAAIYL